ncbi:juvenile hormone esterase-like [Anopheles aquasalis]|uniref:juvenile hormone esterase-like n=1 Tax=Anopheles aquasalis TaxID=42839 RepID=UPI00215A8474|nr:juvenile hormone esterase-like [Anopheles aquasalis]
MRIPKDSFLDTVSLTIPSVCIGDGCIRGTTRIDNENRTYSAYLGIPYAKPPVRELRFANPVPNDPWDGTYDASMEKDSCTQKIITLVLGSEDCLYLNVFVPQLTTFENTGLLPVMLYIHGGAFSRGAAITATRDPVRLMSTRRVIVVTIQYRLGVLGFLSTGDLSASGNFGMKDQVLAMRWVQKNIRTFGGDPQLVTIFGESAGGASVQYHMLSPMSRGLFKRAISMSGSALSLWSVPMVNPLETARKQAKAVGIMDADTLSTAELINKLRTTPALSLVNVTDKLNEPTDISLTVYRPTIEPREASEPFLVEDPRDIWNRGDYKGVPWLTGAIPTDGSIAVQNVLRRNLTDTINTQFISLLPRILSSKIITRPMIRALRQRFYQNVTAGQWISEDLYEQATQLISESWFLYPMVGSIKQHLANRKPQPTSVYSFEFKGRQSHSSRNTNSTMDYGLTHDDEMIYIFRAPLFFPVDFPVGSPEAEMSRQWIKHLIDFASTRSAGKVGSCIGQSCSVVRFRNSNSRNGNPVSRTITSGLDEEMFKFWSNYYKSGGSY